jgi:hypothetical protein
MSLDWASTGLPAARTLAGALHAAGRVRPHVRRPLTARRFERHLAQSATPGRRLADIVAEVAEPVCLLRRIDGSQVGHWQSAPGFGRIRAMTLLFDATGSCVGRLGPASRPSPPA